MGDLPATADVVVVGGGICGLACAASAAARGAEVVLVDKEDGPGREGSGRAQGSLRLQGREAVEFPLAQEAIRLWRQAGEEAAADGTDFELVFAGNVYLCDDEAELPTIRRLVDEAHRFGLRGVELLTPEQARAVIPAAQGPFVAAMYSPVDGHCQPDKATVHYARKAARAGAGLHYGHKAVRLLADGGAVRGVETDRGAIEAGAVVVAAGIWTPYLSASAGVQVPVMPVALSEAETVPVAPLFEQTIRAFGFGGRQRPDGRVVFSAGINTTVDHAVTLYDLRHLRLWVPRLLRHWKDVNLSLDLRRVGAQLRRGSALAPELIDPAPDPPPNVPAMDAALASARRLIPGLAGVPIARRWAGMVDMSPDGLPIVDAHAGPDRLVVVTGLSGHGLTLGPVLGEIAADLALTGRTPRPVHPFRLARFGEGTVPIPAKMI